MTEERATSENRELTVARWIATLFSAGIVAFGIFAIVTRHYHGETTKLGGAVVDTTGSRAVWMGIGEVFFGLFPLALWASRPRHAAVWAASCLVLGLSVFFGSYLLVK